MRSKIATPGQEKGQTFIEAARRAQIVECAIEAISELGYARASLAEIAKRAGISKSVILYHFSGKDELIEEVVKDIYMRGFHEQFPQVIAEPTYRDKLRKSIEANVRWIVEHPQWVAALAEIFSGFRREDGTPRYTAADNEPIVRGLELLLAEGQKAGEFRRFPLRPMALTIRSAIDAIPQLMAFPGFDVDRYAVELADIFDAATRNEARSNSVRGSGREPGAQAIQPEPQGSLHRRPAY